MNLSKDFDLRRSQTVFVRVLPKKVYPSLSPSEQERQDRFPVALRVIFEYSQYLAIFFNLFVKIFVRGLKGNISSKLPRPQGGALKPKSPKPKTEIPKQVRDDKRRRPIPCCYAELVSASDQVFSAFSRHTFHPRPCLPAGRHRTGFSGAISNKINNFWHERKRRRGPVVSQLCTEALSAPNFWATCLWRSLRSRRLFRRWSPGVFSVSG